MQVTRSVIAASALIGMCSVLNACAPAPIAQSDHLRLLHSGVLAFQARFDRLPDTFDEVCRSEPSWCRLMDTEDWLADRWQSQVRYSRLEDSYQLRSAGADRRFGTDDDVVFDPARDARLAMPFQGCYELMERRKLNGMSAFRLSLSPSGSGAYSIDEIRGESGDPYRAEWHPIAPDSVLLRLVRTDGGYVVKARLVADELRTQHGTARRAPCV